MKKAIKTRKPKAPKLVLGTRQAMAKYKKKYPAATIQEIAGRYNCTYAQAQKALKDDESGLLFRSRRANSKPVDQIVGEKSPDEIFQTQYHTALAQLEADKEIDFGTRITMLEKLAGINKNLRAMRLAAHLKGADEALIWAIIKRFEPEASEERIVQIFREEYARCQNSQ